MRLLFGIMFNVHVFERQRKSIEAKECADFQMDELRTKNKAKNNLMAQKYRQRVGHFIKTMVADKGRGVQHEDQDYDKMIPSRGNNLVKNQYLRQFRF
jgi:hypothetical protein